MRRMESQALKTMAAIRAVGHENDRVAGSTRTSRGFAEQERMIRNAGRAARGSDRDFRALGNTFRRTERDADGLVGKLRRVATTFAGLRALMRVGIWAAMGVGITALAQAVGVLAGGFVALIPQVISAAGALAALPAAVGAAVQGIGTLKLALGGVGDALKAGMALQTDAGRTARDYADKTRTSARQVRDAHEGIVQAARGARNAEEALALSHRNESDAQRRLTEARREARRELTDMALAAQAAALGQKRADITLRQARESLATRALDPFATDVDIMSSELDVSEAALGRRQATIDARRARADARRTRGRGIGRNQGVIDANRSLADAKRGIRDASEGVTDAEHAQRNATESLSDAQREANRLTVQGTGDMDKYRQSMKQLSPEGRSFVRHLVGMRPALMQLRRAAGRDLFPQLERGLTRGMRLLPILERGLRRTGGVIGRQAEGLAGDLTTRRRQGDIEALMEHQAGLLNRMGRGTRNLTSAVVDLAVAARPFTNWLARTVEGWTKWAKESAAAGRQTGTIRTALERTRSNLERFGRILKNIWGVMRDVGRAASPLGNRLWDGADKATRGWKDYLDTVEGTAKARSWFNRLYKPLHELGQLTKDLAVAWAHVTVDESFTQSVRGLRRAVPDLERLMRSLSGLGPAAADTLAQIIRLLANLPFSPINLLLRAFNMLLRAVNTLLEKVPGLGLALSGLLLAGALTKSLSLVGTLLTRWRALFALWRGGGGPPVGPGGAPGAPGAGGFGIFPGGFGGTRPGRLGRAASGAYRGARMGGAGRLAALGAAWGGLGTAAGRLGGIGGLARAGLGAAGRIVLPISAIAGVMGAISAKGGVGDRVMGFGDAASFGLAGRARKAIFGGTTTTADLEAQQAKLTGGEGRRISGILGRIGGPRGDRNAGDQIRILRSMISIRRGEVGAEKRLREQLEQRLEVLKDIHKQEIRTRNLRSEQHGERLAKSFARAFEVLKGPRGPVAAMDSVHRGVLAKMAHMRPAGARVMAQNTLAWARTIAKGNPALQREVERMERGIIRKFSRMGKTISIVNGQILTGSRSEWRNISMALRDPAEKAREEVSRSFTAMQQKAIGSLTAMGYDRTEATYIVRNLERGMSESDARRAASRGRWGMHARGGRISGAGLADTVPVAPGHLAAPGELIVNRHTERRVDARLAAFGTSLGREVLSERRPHAAGYAFGGRFRVGNLGHPELRAGIAEATERVLGKFPGLTVTATTGGHHAKDSLHYSGQAVDLAASMNPAGIALMDRAAGWTGRNLGAGLAEGIHNPNLSVKAGRNVPSSTWGAETWAQHLNHIHMGVLGGALLSGTAAGRGGLADTSRAISAIHLRAAASAVAGAPGAMSNRARQAIAKGMTERINAITGATGGVAEAARAYHGRLNRSFPRHFMGQPGVRLSQRQVARLATLAGLPGDTFARIAHGESDFYPGVQQRDPGDGMVGYGLWQITPNAWGRGSGAYKHMQSLGGVAAMFNPWKNALMAKYLYDHAGSKSPNTPGFPWYGTAYLSHGGRVSDVANMNFAGWHGRGGRFRVNRPTVFGAGESGEEDVTIRPHGASGTRHGGAVFNVHIDHIDYHGEGDIADVISDELAKVADDLDLSGNGEEED